MDIQRLTILGGVGKDGRPEAVDVVQLEMGNVVSIVGPTGSGKTTLINDLELFADDNTPSRRRVLAVAQGQAGRDGRNRAMILDCARRAAGAEDGEFIRVQVDRSSQTQDFVAQRYRAVADNGSARCAEGRKSIGVGARRRHGQRRIKRRWRCRRGRFADGLRQAVPSQGVSGPCRGRRQHQSCKNGNKT